MSGVELGGGGGVKGETRVNKNLRVREQERGRSVSL